MPLQLVTFTDAKGPRPGAMAGVGQVLDLIAAGGLPAGVTDMQLSLIHI
jgi:hypothetical protein